MADSPIELVTLKDRRKVAVHRLAEGDSGRTLVFCHPAPGAGTFDPDPALTHARGVTLIATDRPGYGQSDPFGKGIWPSVSAAADDIAAVLDHISAGPCGVAGWSAGGRVALALAARRPDLVERVVVLGTPAPNEAVPWIPPEHAKALGALRDMPADEAVTALMEQLTPTLPTDATSPEALEHLASPIDETALTLPGARERLGVMLQAAYAQGIVGAANDLAAYCLQPWGFEMDAVQAKTLLLYGSKDPIADARHGTWWQKHLPNARLEVVPGAGHMLVLSMWDRALSHLAPKAKRRS